MKRKLRTELDRDMVMGFIKRLDLKRLYLVEVTEKKAKRSISQNKLYWLWLTCISHETGNDRDDLHDYFKKKFLLPETVIIFGEEVLRYSSADLDKSRFSTYLDSIQVFASSELAISLPLPSDQSSQEFYDYYIDKL